MTIHGFIIHHKDPLRKILKRVKETSKHYNIRFEIDKVEDYSWKIENFEKIHIKIFFPRKFNDFSYVMRVFNEIILRSPTEVTVSNGDLSFGYYVPDELKTSLEDIASFALFLVKEKLIIFTKEDLNKFQGDDSFKKWDLIKMNDIWW